MAYSRPGVYVTESPLKTLARRNPGTATAAFVGTAARGPVTPTLIDSWSSYTTTFGALENAYDLGYAVYQYFANGGRACYVTRAVYTNASTASAASVGFYTPATTAASSTLFGATALNPGAYGNNIKITMTAGLVPLSVGTGGAPSTMPTFNLKVALNGSEVESWTELSPDPNSSRYAPTIVNTFSSYINVTSFASTTASAGFQYEGLGVERSLTGGSDGTGASADSWDAPFQTALDALANLDEPLIINAVGQTRNQIVGRALSVAATRGDSFVIIDPDSSLTAASAITASIANYTTNTGYGAVYYPMLKMTDPVKTGVGAIRNTYPGGAIAGIYARTEIERTVAKPPAGYAVDVRNAIGLVTKFTDAEVGTLYDAGVNTFKAVPGAGIVVQGARTLQKVRPDKYVSVRRSLNYIKNGVHGLTQSAVFEPNDERLWNSITMRLNKFLSDFWGAGGLRGRTPNEAFYVVCDSSNNTQTTIDNGEVHVEIGVSLLYPAEYIVINVSQWLGGNSTAENL